MIGYLKGKVIIIEKDSIILNVNDVGYQVLVVNPYEYKINNVIELFIYTNVKEDQFTLFGFNDIEQKHVFLKLISVKGVGPKTALNMLASINYIKLSEAISNEDVSLIKKLPGIGPKSAAQIVLDLKGKLIIDSKNLNKELDDALEALVALGYKTNEVKKVEEKLKTELLTTEEYIKQGLQILLK